MEAAMTIANKLRQYLDSEGVHYDVTAHPRTATTSESAEAAHIPGSWMAKSVVVHHELGYVLAVVPSTHRVEFPPIGAAYGVPVVLDESVGDAPHLYFEGGDHKSLVHVSADGFRVLTKDARRARFSHHA
jgi:Ala-tRNA(Pro) deacylase